MGQEIPKSSFSEREFQRFSHKLHRNLAALKQVLQRSDFGRQEPVLGAELELYLIDRQGYPSGINQWLQQQADDPQVTLELNQYNLEYNFDTFALAGQPFSALESAMLAVSEQLDSLAAVRDAQIVPIGILPTLTEADMGEAVMTPLKRYRALSDMLLTMRGGQFDVDINGEDSLSVQRNDLTLEGACTSFQVHYSFPIDQFVDTWNAIMLVTPLVLALSTNSPLLFGKRLWHETRVPLFKQSTDSRRHNMPWHDLPRVELGYDWLRRSPYELFAQRVLLYPPLIAVCNSESPESVLAEGRLPSLHELNLHNGTIWHWNRPIYSNKDEGHIRIEMRSLPAGPTPVDMVANAAFHIGLAVGLRDEIEELLPATPFRFVSENFYQAARHGLDASLIWPSLMQNRLWDKPVRALALSLLDKARQGLEQLGVEKGEVKRLLAVIKKRLDRNQNGSSWQLKALARLQQKHSLEQALVLLVQNYTFWSKQNIPVAEWEFPQWARRYG